MLDHESVVDTAQVLPPLEAVALVDVCEPFGRLPATSHVRGERVILRTQGEQVLDAHPPPLLHRLDLVIGWFLHQLSCPCPLSLVLSRALAA